MATPFPPNSPRIFDKVALACLALAVVVFASYLGDIAPWSGATLAGHDLESYAFFRKGTDMSAYCLNARGILAGEWPRGPFFRAPLYSYLIAALAWFDEGMWMVAAAQALMATATVALIYAVAKIIFDRTTAVGAALATILYGGYVFWIAVPHSAVTEVFLSALSLYFVITLRKRFTPLNAALAGAACGVLCLARPNFLAVAPPVLAGVALERVLIDKKIRPALVRLWVAGLAFALFIMPPVIWNNVQSEELILAPNTNGSVGYVNSNSADSLVYGYRAAKGPLLPVTSAAFWTHQVAKTLAFWKSVEYPQNENFLIFRRFSTVLPLLFVNFGLVGAAYLAGCVLFCGRFRAYWPLYVWPLGYAATIIVFHIIGRYRLPAIPAMTPMAAAFIVVVARQLRRKFRGIPTKSLKIKTAACVAVFAAALLFSKPWATVDRPLYWRNLSLLYFYDLDFQGYQYCLNRLMEKDPDPSTFLNHVAAAALSGRIDEARLEITRAMESLPRKAYLSRTLAEIEMLRKARDGELPNDAWDRHRRRPASKTGHVARMRNSLDEIVAMRERFELPTPKGQKP